MKKNSFIILLLLPVIAFSQGIGSISESQKQDIIEQINIATKSMKSMSCDFDQSKRLEALDYSVKSSGVLFYTQSSLLRWEYKQPYQYVFVINGDKITLKSSQSKNEIDVKSNRMFKEIANVIINSVTGNCLADGNFKVDIADGKSQWIVKLTSVNKNIKKMFPKITLFFDKKSLIVSKIKLFEKSGDLTEIVLKNVKLNIPINEKVFIVD